MTVDCWCYALYEARVDVVRVDHALEFIELGLGERSEKGLSVLLAVFFLTADIGTAL